MDGIEKITAHIQQDAAKEADQVLATAQAEADAIAAKWDAQARQETDAILDRGRKNAAERGERMASVAQMEGRKRMLAVKQDMIGEAFDAALAKLCSLPEAEAVDVLAALCVQAAVTGREEVILSPRDQKRYGKQVVSAANEILGKKVAPKLPEELTETSTGAFIDKMVTKASALLSGTGMLTLSAQTRDIKGGVILSADGVEVNCSFETLLRLDRPELEKEVAQTLFG